ncbi:MAG: type VI secretion system tip protein VgrG, partial [Pseudomonadales bacterium]
ADGNVELGMPGTFSVKAAQHNFSGPQSASIEFNTWDATPFDDAYIIRDSSTDEPLANTAVELRRGDGALVRLITDAKGRLPMQQDLLMDLVNMRIMSSDPAAESDPEASS